MDREARRRLEEYRRNEAGPIENTLIDEFAAGEFDRKELIRRAGIFGVSASVIGTLLGALGVDRDVDAGRHVRMLERCATIRSALLPSHSSGTRPAARI